MIVEIATTTTGCHGMMTKSTVLLVYSVMDLLSYHISAAHDAGSKFNTSGAERKSKYARNDVSCPPN